MFQSHTMTSRGAVLDDRGITRRLSIGCVAVPDRKIRRCGYYQLYGTALTNVKLYASPERAMREPFERTRWLALYAGSLGP